MQRLCDNGACRTAESKISGQRGAERAPVTLSLQHHPANVDECEAASHHSEVVAAESHSADVGVPHDGEEEARRLYEDQWRTSAPGPQSASL